jgi:hypothetical protein
LACVNRGISQLRADIERCRRLARDIGDSKTRENLLRLALKFEQQLQELEGDPRGPPPVDGTG